MTLKEFNLPPVISGRDGAGYRKAKKGEVSCGDCKYTKTRWWSNRLECTFEFSGQVVGRTMTCGKGEKNPLEVTK